MADDEDKEKAWQESVVRSKAFTPVSPDKLLEGIRKTQEGQERQAETGRVFAPPAKTEGRQPGEEAQQFLKPFTGPGSTPARKRFWNAARNAIIASRKVAGRHVTVDEHPGKGTVINVDDTSSRRPPIGGGGGPPSPVTGACCHTDHTCTIATRSDCRAGGGTYQGDHTTCSPNPCVACGPTVTLCKCGFPDCDGTRYYFTRTFDDTWDDQWTSSATSICHTTGFYHEVSQYTLALDGTCGSAAITDCSGSAHRKTSGIDGCGAMDDECTITFPTCACPNSCWDYGHCIAWALDHANPQTHDCTGTVTTVSDSTSYTSGTDHAVGSRTQVATLSDEYTTDMLIANAIALLPPPAEGCSSEAHFILNADETCCTAHYIAA